MGTEQLPGRRGEGCDFLQLTVILPRLLSFGSRHRAARRRKTRKKDAETAAILLLCGGDKRTQAKDIEQAHEYWKDYKARKPKPSVPSGKPSAKRGRGRRLH